MSTKPEKTAIAKADSKTGRKKLAAIVDIAARQTIMRDRKNQWARSHIAEVAVQLFEKKGFAATTIDEIAAASDYSNSTFFRLFADKEEVVFYDFSERMEELKAIFSAPGHGNTWEAIRRVLIEFAKLYKEGDLGIRRARLYHDEPVLYARFLLKCSEWEDAIARLVAAEFRGDPKQKLLCQMVAGAAILAFRAAWRAKLADDKLAFADCVQDAFDKLEGLGLFFRAPPAAGKKRSAARIGKTSRA